VSTTGILGCFDPEDAADARVAEDLNTLHKARSDRYRWATEVDPVAVIEFELRAKLYRNPAVVMSNG
jgi:hypothetical protein